MNSVEKCNQEWINTLEKRRDELQEITFTLFSETQELQIALDKAHRKNKDLINDAAYWKEKYYEKTKRKS